MPSPIIQVLPGKSGFWHVVPAAELSISLWGRHWATVAVLGLFASACAEGNLLPGSESDGHLDSNLTGGHPSDAEESTDTSGSLDDDGGNDDDDDNNDDGAVTSDDDDDGATQVPGSCDDGEKNDAESDIDCGGSACPPCADGLDCLEPSDCASLHCEAGECQPGTCEDGSLNQNESATDCGGECPPCPPGEACMGPEDCIEKVCLNGQCQQAGCGDAVHNGKESDVDCGGSDCKSCENGESCSQASDCKSGVCTDGICEKADCVEDGDCAHLNGECTVGRCDLAVHVCESQPANNGVACDSQTPCVRDETCNEGTCGQGTPLDCTALDSGCSQGYCDQAQDSCVTRSVVSFFEPFSVDTKNTRPWTVDGSWSEWETGPARSSAGCYYGQDPATDHTSGSSDNWLLGTVIGGCTFNGSTELDCVYSPTIDLSDAQADDVFSFYRHLHQPMRPDAASAIYFFDQNQQWISIEPGYNENINDSQWKRQSLAIGGYRHSKFRIAICTWRPNNYEPQMGGWSVDDVLIAPSDCTPEVALAEGAY